MAVPPPGGTAFLQRFLADPLMSTTRNSGAGGSAVSRKFGDWFFFNLTRAFAALTLLVLAGIIISLIVGSWPAIEKFGLRFLWTRDWNPPAEEFGALIPIYGTIVTSLIALIIAVPVSFGIALFLTELSPVWLRRPLGTAIELLAAIPSIVYGLFGMLFFVTKLHWGYSMIAGAFTLAIMVLPVIMRTTEEALIAVPDSYREGSFGLGAGKLRTVFTIVLPSAMPGILSGVILATGRIVGETAALIYTASSVAKIPSSVFSSTRTLAVHMYLLSNEGLYIGQTYGTAVVLLVLVLVINGLSGLVAGKLAKR